MHIHFIAIGGAGIGPLAQIALKAGYSVSGSDIRDSAYIRYLKDHGVSDIEIGQDESLIAAVHERNPIDWVVYSSAVTMVDKSPPILEYCRSNAIKYTKRDEFINKFINDKNLQMIAVAGTHGKTTTTAMLVWLFKGFNLPISYLLPAKVNYGEMGEYAEDSSYFIYEADEFDRNFLAFKPAISLISGVSYDHQEIYPTVDDYKQAFKDFIKGSTKTYIWDQDASYLAIDGDELFMLDHNDELLNKLTIVGLYNRYDALLAINAFISTTDVSLEQAINRMNNFPGLSRRMEEIAPNLYSDYAHTPEKIVGAMSAASEIAAKSNQKLVIIYEPLTNRRQAYMAGEYKDCFKGASKLYWLPSYLAREDPAQKIIKPEELIAKLTDPSIAEPAMPDSKLKELIDMHLSQGDMVVAMAGGGGGSLDDWLREQYPA
ncbi:MAG TPA: Mur ligase domain-containing protein [Candidatus Saccharimonadales bacterium]